MILSTILNKKIINNITTVMNSKDLALISTINSQLLVANMKTMVAMIPKIPCIE